MYDLSQRRCVAREVARAGGILRKAVVNLRRNYESFDNLSVKTVRRMLDRPYFQRLFQEQEELLTKALAESELEAEISRARVAVTGKSVARQAALDSIRQLRASDSNTPSPASLKVLLNYLEFLNRL